MLNIWQKLLKIICFADFFGADGFYFQMIQFFEMRIPSQKAKLKSMKRNRQFTVKNGIQYYFAAFFIVYSKSIYELILPKNAFKCCCTWQFNVLCALDITYHYQINERNTNTCYLKKMWVCPWLKIVLISFLLFKTIIRIFYLL